MKKIATIQDIENESYIIYDLYTHNGFNFVVGNNTYPTTNEFCQLSNTLSVETYRIDIDVIGRLTIDVDYCFDDLYYGNAKIDCDAFITRYKELFPEQCNQYN